MGWIITLTVLSLEILGVITALHAIMTVRSSQGAIAWALTLVLMPILALPCYWVFGRNRFRGYVKARRTRNEAVRHIVQQLQNSAPAFMASLDESFQSLRTLERLCHMPFTRGNRVKLLVNGDATFDEIFRAIESAQDYLLIQFYIVRDDAIGRELRDRLVEKARQGVAVYFLYDSVGCYGTMSKMYLRSMREAGIDIRAFKTTKGWGNRFQLNFRNHRKILIADGRIGFVGGHNVGDEYLGRDRQFGAWRDTHVAVEGPAVQCMQLAFLEDWYFVANDVPELRWEPPEVHVPGSDVLVLASGPADRLETWALSLLQIIQSAQRRLWIASPYFVPDATIVSALQMAVIRGVDVRILIPYRPDHWMVYLATCSYVQTIDPMGVKFSRYHPGFLHEKVILADDLAMVGTANLDNRSIRLNFEIMLAVADTAFAEHVEEMLDTDLQNSRRITAVELNKTPIWFRFGVRVARLLAPIL